MKSPFSFPEEVNETSARLVAGGVVTLSAVTIATDQPWLAALLVYGFVARVLFGPRCSPLARLATDVITPRLALSHRFSPGPPKRLAQAMGLAMSSAALLVGVVAGSHLGCDLLLAGLMAAAAAEALVGFCAGCKIFYALMRAGLIPATTCETCNDISLRRSLAA